MNDQAKRMPLPSLGEGFLLTVEGAPQSDRNYSVNSTLYSKKKRASQSRSREKAINLPHLAHGILKARGVVPSARPGGQEALCSRASLKYGTSHDRRELKCGRGVPRYASVRRRTTHPLLPSPPRTPGPRPAAEVLPLALQAPVAGNETLAAVACTTGCWLLLAAGCWLLAAGLAADCRHHSSLLARGRDN